MIRRVSQLSLKYRLLKYKQQPLTQLKRQNANIIRLPLLSKPLLRYNFIIGRLFKKKHQQGIKRQEQNEQKRAKQIFQDQKQMLRDIQQQSDYDFSKRKQQIELNKDFRKQRQLHSKTIPEDIGKGGINQLVYWSQNALTPQQIFELVQKFNKISQVQINKEGSIEDQIAFAQFKENVKATVYLLDRYSTMVQYAYFGYKYGIKQENSQFWKKIEEKMMRKEPTAQQINDYIDIVFVMGNMEEGELIYPAVEKIVENRDLTTQQITKLLIAFFKTQKGQKQFIVALVIQLQQNIQDFTPQIIESVLPVFKQSKRIPSSFDKKLENKIIELAAKDIFPLSTICTICQYFGFQKGSEKMYQQLERTTRQKVMQIKRKSKNNRLPSDAVQSIILGIFSAYKFSNDFFLKHVIPQIQFKNQSILFKLKPTTLSCLSKCLYIYQLQQQTKSIENTIQQLILKHFQKASEVSSEQLIQVLKDYTVTRIGSRQFYLFLEKIVNQKLHQLHTDRYALQAFAAIYEESNLCAPQTLQLIKGLIDA